MVEKVFLIKGRVSQNILILVLLTVLTGGCSSTNRVRILWPLPPETPSLEFVGVYASSGDFTRSEADLWENALSGKYETIFNRPFGVAVDNEGRVFVADNLTKEIKVLNFAEKKITTFGFNQPFNLPLDLAFDSSYNLYVVDGNRNKIIVFDQRGVGLFEFGNEKNLLAPSYIAINDKIERIYVSQGRLHQISVFDLTGKYLFKFGQPGVDNGEFAAPQGMAIDSMGNLYVADMLNSRIQIFDQNGTYLSSFKFVGNTRYPYENPKDLEFGTDGNLYILDQRKALLISYTPEGKFLFAIGGNSRTTHPLGFSSPSSIDIDKKGKIYITDQLNRRLTLWQILTKSYLSKNPVNERDRQNILKLLE